MDEVGEEDMSNCLSNQPLIDPAFNYLMQKAQFNQQPEYSEVQLRRLLFKAARLNKAEIFTNTMDKVG